MYSYFSSTETRPTARGRDRDGMAWTRVVRTNRARQKRARRESCILRAEMRDSEGGKRCEEDEMRGGWDARRMVVKKKSKGKVPIL
jgi:hypothetical protein